MVLHRRYRLRTECDGVVFVSASSDHLEDISAIDRCCPMIGLELTRPWMLLALLVAAPALAYYFVHSLSDFPRPQRIVSLATRLCIVLLLILALAGLTLLHSTDEKFVIFVVDQSTS